jgi:hypothetical protein
MMKQIMQQLDSLLGDASSLAVRLATKDLIKTNPEDLQRASDAMLNSAVLAHQKVQEEVWRMERPKWRRV